MADEIMKAAGAEEMSNIVDIEQWTDIDGGLTAEERDALIKNYFAPWNIKSGDTASTIEYKVANKIYSNNPLSPEELYNPEKAIEQARQTQKIINQVKMAFKKAFAKKYGTISIKMDELATSIPVQAILYSCDIKLLREGAGRSGDLNVLENLYAIPEYDNNYNRTGLWKTFKFRDGCHGIIDILVNNMCPGMNTRYLNSIINGLCISLAGNAPRGYETFENYDFKIIPCYNGLVDGRNNQIKVIPWTDTDTLTQEYGDLCPTWKCPVPYDPNTKIPDWNPIDFIYSLHEDKEDDYKELTVKLLLQTMQFALRGFSGAGKWFVWFCNDEGTANGMNGKSTLIMMLTYLMTLNMGTADRVVKTNVDRMFSGSNNFALGELDRCILHAAEEVTNPIRDVGAFREYTRCEDGMTIEQKYHSPFQITPYWCKIQALNGIPPIGQTSRDKTGASFTRQLYFTFNMDFSGDKKDTKIQDYYIKDLDILTYLMKVLVELPWDDDYNRDETEDLNQPILDSVFEENIESISIIKELLDKLCEDNGDIFGRPDAGIDASMLYEFYLADCQIANIRFTVSKKNFIRDLRTFCNSSGKKLWKLDETTYAKNSKGDNRKIYNQEIRGVLTGRHCPELLPYAEITMRNKILDYEPMAKYVSFNDHYMQRKMSKILFALPDNPYYTSIPEDED